MTRSPPFQSRTFPPRFVDEEVERDYLDDDRPGALRRLRAGLVVAAAAWAGFGLLCALSPLPPRAAPMSFALCGASLLAALVIGSLRFSPPGIGAVLNASTGFAVLCVGIPILHHPAVTLSGALLVILYSAAFFRLPVIHAVWATMPTALALQALLVWPPEGVQVPGAERLTFSAVLWIGEGFALAAALVSERAARISFERKKVIEHQQSELREERARSDRLLRNVLPGPIADRLRIRQEVIAEGFEEVTILFCDLVGFTELASRTAPPEVVSLLDRVFTRFDAIAERHGLEKIKTIGDAYMAAAGVPVPRDDHAEAAAATALEMLEAIDALNQEQGLTLKIRIGLNSGPVVAGVIGQRKFAYDLWGDAVNTAARMESQGLEGCIQVTAATRERLLERFDFEARGTIEVKGKGPMKVYLLRGVTGASTEVERSVTGSGD